MARQRPAGRLFRRGVAARLGSPRLGSRQFVRRLRLDIEYDGTDFAGWQVQPDCRTVQGEIGTALETIVGRPVSVVAAGRTDAGVHARAQVAHVDVPDLGFDLDRLTKSVGALTGPDVAIIRVTDVPDDFHARFSAVSRTYVYRMSRRQRALDRAFVLRLRGDVDIRAMRQAAVHFVGRYAATSLCAAGAQDADAEVCVESAHLTDNGDQISFEITADRFVMHMVRIVVGTLLEVARGNRDADSVIGLIGAKDRSQAGPTAPACGLCLERVGYRQ